MKKITLSLIALAMAITSFSQGNGYLGISMGTVDNGVRISEVLENGSALVYGLKINDIIQSVDGKEIKTNSDLKNIVTSKNWGESINIFYLRNNVVMNQNVTLGNRADKIAYRVVRIVKGDKVTWSFDNKTFIVIQNEEAIEMKKVVGETVNSVNLLEEATIPQNFSDFDDKMEMIEAINERNAGKKAFPRTTIYIKTYTSESKIKAPVATNNSTLKVYPNPSNGIFTFDFKALSVNDKNLTWNVIDITGKEIMNNKTAEFNGKFSSKIDLTKLTSGVYLLRVVNDKSVFTERMVVKR